MYVTGEREGRESVSRVWLNNIDCFKKVKIVCVIVGPFHRPVVHRLRHRPFEERKNKQDMKTINETSFY